MKEDGNIEQLPEGWKKVTLGKVATYINGKAFKPIEWSREGLPIIRIQNLNKDKSEFNYCNFEVDKKFHVSKGDLLFAWSGTPDTSFGAHIWKGENAVLNQHIFKIIIDQEQIGKKYYLYALNHKVKEFVSKAHGTAGLAHITKKKFEESEIYLPSLSIQQAIVSKIEELFSELDKGIDNLRIARQQLKTYRQSVLKWAFEGRLTNEDVKNGELPKGWKWVKISDVAHVGTGATPLKSKAEYYGGNIPWVTSGALNDEYVREATDFVTEKAIKETNLSLYPKHTLLVAMYGEGKTRGKCSELLIEACTNQAIAAIYFDKHDISVKPYLKYFLLKNYEDVRKKSSGGVQPNLNLGIIKNLLFPYASITEQHSIVEAIESRLSVADKMEESITQSLQQAEALRQSILKKAFEGKLVVSKQATLYKPQNEYFYQSQLLGFIIIGSKKKDIQHGEMTIAKYAYLLDKIYDVPTYFNYQRWHLGPYPPEMKKVILNKNFFSKTKEGIDVIDEKKILKYSNPLKAQTEEAVNKLTDVFHLYSEKERAHKTELLATVCKVIEDIQTLDIKAIRTSMKEWKIELKNSAFKSKAEKFSESETKKCLKFIEEKGWDKKILKYY